MRSGPPQALSLRDALVHAHEVREVYDPSPLVTVAVGRLLQAVLYRVFRPETEADWARLWRAGRFDEGRLDGYGGVWADRFDLLHPTHPFDQVPRIDEEKVHPVTALIMEAASGNNPTLFDHGLAEGGNGLPLSRAACHLVTHQLFALGGGVSKPFNRMDGPLTKGLVVEAKSAENLFETLLLNLVPLRLWHPLVPQTNEDRPFWEVDDPPEPVREGTLILGPLHYLTWQSRQIHLVVDSDSGLVTGCQIRQRYCLPKDGAQIDPGKAYRKSKDEGWLPFKLDKERAAWRSTHALLQQTEEDQARPYLMDWLATARATERTVPRVVLLTVSGLTTDPMKAAKIELWRREQLPLPLAFLERPELVRDLEHLLTGARWAEILLKRTATALVWAIGERKHLDDAVGYIFTEKVAGGGKVPPNFAALAGSLGLATRFWPALEAPFRQAMRDLPDVAEFGPVAEGWQKAVEQAASQAFAAVRDGLLYSEAPFEVLTRIDHAFHVRLSGIFTAATQNQEGSEPNDPDAIE
jgi:CRISPR system Cascade subunit CasA